MFRRGWRLAFRLPLNQLWADCFEANSWSASCLKSPSQTLFWPSYNLFTAGCPS
ncbi:hypothetical protein ACMBCN_03175 [Candidatus Liberibacter asiaticus]|nr:hypothetical protein [Candidatus Liberibacter asiaticus]